MGESEIKRLVGLVASPEILNPKSKVNNLYPITVRSAMFQCSVNNFPRNPDTFPPAIIPNRHIFSFFHKSLILLVYPSWVKRLTSCGNDFSPRCCP